MRKSDAIIDLIIIALTTGAIWSLRFFNVSNVGAMTMAVGLLTVYLVLKLRKQAYDQIGLPAFALTPDFWRRVRTLFAWFGLAWLGAGVIAGAIFGTPETSSVITGQPQEFLPFLFDITVITWILIAFGEEVVFRGFILHRLTVLTGESRSGWIAAALLQAIWFGAGHASQGISGMLITGSVGFTFALFYLSRPTRNLWPLILVHGIADTVLLTLAWVF